jgi:DnaK suppressor protein
MAHPFRAGNATNVSATGDRLLVMDAERARQLLMHERSRIESAIVARAEQERSALDEQGEPGSERLYETELETGLAEDLREQLAAVERAEARLAAGTYGLSVDSGEPIPDARLEALPAAERTLEEQQARGR